jgi:ABC-2 type transport system permease protein
MSTADAPRDGAAHRAEARIADVRLQRWEGQRSGRAAAVWALARWSASGALGARRGWKAKLAPVALSLMALAPAIVVLGVRALLPGDGIDLDEITFSGYQRLTGLVILIFAGLVASEVMCPDRRDGVLPLYFATAVSRGEYVLAKFVATALPMLLVTLVPMLVLYVGIVVFEDAPVTYLQENWLTLGRIVASGALVAGYFALVGIAISSLTSRRAYAVGAYLALLVGATAAAGTLGEIDAPRWVDTLRLSTIPAELGARLYPGADSNSSVPIVGWALAYGVVAIIAGAVLVQRFRRDDP